MFPMFVVDLLHEVEIGVWRSLFIHLLRIFECIGPTIAHKLDERCVFSYYVMFNNSTSPKLSGSPYIWEGHYSQVLEKLLRNEEASSTRLRESTSGNGPSYFPKTATNPFIYLVCYSCL